VLAAAGGRFVADGTSTGVGTWAARLLLALAGLAVSGAAGAQAGCSSPAGPDACTTPRSAPLVSPGSATVAVRALWAAREKANIAKNIGALNGLDTGSLLLQDHFMLASAAAGESTWYWTQGPRTLQHVTVYVPRQQRYPLFFAAQILAATSPVSQTDGAVTAYMIVTRSSATQPWRIALQVFDGGYAPPAHTVQQPNADGNGFDAAVPASFAAKAKKWPTLLAAYYQHIKQHGAPPAGSPFEPCAETTGTDLANRRDGAVENGVAYHYRFLASSLGGPWVFNDTGHVEVCADIDELQVMTQTNPNLVFNQVGANGPTWGAGLAPGQYTSLTRVWERAVCIAQHGNKLAAWGDENPAGRQILFTGKRA
jgi:hypothetical protein